jgi:hypothetical protein
MSICGVQGKCVNNVMHAFKVDKSDVQAYEHNYDSIILCSILHLRFC